MSILSNGLKKFTRTQLKVKSGDVYGRLTVICRVQDRKLGYPRFLCQCACGKRLEVDSCRLRTRFKGTKSCGCLHSEAARRVIQKYWKLPAGHAARNLIFGKYRWDAKKNKREFSISFEDFCRLTQENCHYCGSSPATVAKHAEVNGIWIYNGLDRVDNARGYTLDNVVPSCPICAFAKRNLTVDRFLELVRVVWKHQRLGV